MPAGPRPWPVCVAGAPVLCTARFLSLLHPALLCPGPLPSAGARPVLAADRLPACCLPACLPACLVAAYRSANSKPAAMARYWGVRVVVPAGAAAKWPAMLFMLSDADPTPFAYGGTPLQYHAA